MAKITNEIGGYNAGTISEIFDGGCFAQAWSVAEVLRSWQLINQSSSR